MKIIVLRCLLYALRQVVPGVYTYVDPHHRQPEEARDNAELDEVTWNVRLSWGDENLVLKCTLHATFTFNRTHVLELVYSEQEEADRQRNAVTGQCFPMQIP